MVKREDEKGANVLDAASHALTGRLYRSCRAGSAAVVRITGEDADEVTAVDAFTGGRVRTLSRSSLHTEDYRPSRRSGYVSLRERDFVAELLEATLDKHAGNEEHGALHSVWTHEDWRSGGFARLTWDYEHIGRPCEEALHRAGYGAEPFPRAVSGAGFALRFRRATEQPLCPELEIPRGKDGTWEPWSCDVERDHDSPHHNVAMRYSWVDDDAPELCGAWASATSGPRLGSCSLPAGHPRKEDHRDLLLEYLLGGPGRGRSSTPAGL
ncbi:hypothetical protein [Streptomyces zaomyceticus]|uniref:hypothetical protein n=1 Tax=Streptomyces zaomyceticus TaxID=68286 RepID=UPI0036BE45A0